MQTGTDTLREIPRSEWVGFLNEFSEQHLDSPVSLFTGDGNSGGQPLAENVPLRDISADLKDREDAITINVGRTDTEHEDHIITGVTRVALRTNGDGAHVGLDIATGDGTVTRVQFMTPVKPETMHGRLSNA